jgi:hypothetical protein
MKMWENRFKTAVIGPYSCGDHGHFSQNIMRNLPMKMALLRLRRMASWLAGCRHLRNRCGRASVAMVVLVVQNGHVV